MIPNRKWTESELKYLRDYYGILSTPKMAFTLQRTAGAVRTRAVILRITFKRTIRKPRKSEQILVWDLKKK